MLGFAFMRPDLEYITGILDELENLLQDASKVPMNRGRVMVDRPDALALIGELRGSLPKELEEARAIYREHESITSSAREEAERVVENARQRSQELVEESEPYRRANRRAEENLDTAEKYSEEVSRGSEAYRAQVMAKLERWFGESLESVAESRKGLEVPSDKRASSPGDTEPRERQGQDAQDPEDPEEPQKPDESQSSRNAQESQEGSVAGDKGEGDRGWRASSA